jgi:nitrite reductase/ring-hydroxylating ferredoxin subunit
MTTARDAGPALLGSSEEVSAADALPAGPTDVAGTDGDVATDDQFDGRLNRRRLMRNAAIAGGVVAVGAGLAACGGGSSSASGGGSVPSKPTVLGKTSDIPVGGGKIYPNDNVVVTQPVAGTFKGFSSTCTHMGCTVDKVANGLIQCPCHGSMYSVSDGTVKAGPAPRALPAEKIEIKGTQVVLDA